MMMKYRLICILCSLLVCSSLGAQNDDKAKKPTLNDKVLETVAADPSLKIDTTFVKRYTMLNDYSTIAIQYGANLASASYNPSREISSVFLPVDVGILYTRYCKLFGYMPYFAFQAGVFYSQQAFKFPVDKETGRPSFSLLGAYSYKMPVIEVPFNAMFHYDFWKMKLMVHIGFFAGYRLGIHREYNELQCPDYDERREWQDKFHPNERRFIYGLQGGVGLGFSFEPIEIEIFGRYKYGLSYLYKPNISTATFVEGEHNSNYYYTWLNTTNIVVGIGVHYQLSRSHGSTKRELRKRIKREMEENSRESKDDADKAIEMDIMQ